MLTVISPAKKLNETTVDLPSTLPLSKPALQTSADALAKISRELSCGDLRDLMKISEPLAQLNKDRFS
ncbi:MAG: peroxide stress protein YaaA, partial [Paracoccaceae bacterium]|nr:peroxide stress protein YaaA [Paracoccaceae bacterium]